MGLAVLCGIAVGYNRAHHFSSPQPSRVRVHVLVGLSACLMVLAAGADAGARSRAIQGVATGIGFLGTGEILVDRSGARHDGTPQVHGLTSAASIWFTAALGVTVAASTPVLAVLALVLALIVLSQHGRTHRHPAPSASGPDGPAPAQGHPQSADCPQPDNRHG